MSRKRITTVVATSASLLMSVVMALPAQAGGNSDCNSPSGIGNTGFNGGDGTSADPYQIADQYQLNELHDCLDSGLYFQLTQNIDASDVSGSWEPIGQLFASDTTPGFAGTLDGHDFAISNLRVFTYNLETTYTGMFGKLAPGSHIKNLTLFGTAFGHDSVGMLAGAADTTWLENISVATDVLSRGIAGGVVGLITGQSVLSDIMIDPLDESSEVKAQRGFAGGIAGAYSDTTMETGPISNMSSTIDVISGDAPSTGAESSAGGLFGILIGAALTDSIADAYVSAGSSLWVGGIAGYADYAFISRVGAFGDVVGGTSVGGLVGGSETNLRISESLAHTDVTVTDATGFGGGLVGQLCMPDVNVTDLNCQISNSYARGHVHGEATLGGLIGATNLADSVYVVRSYAATILDKDADVVRGFTEAAAGTSTPDDRNAHLFYDSSLIVPSDTESVIGEQGVKTSAMKKLSTFGNASWDIKQGYDTNVVWNMCNGANDGYPYLSWLPDSSTCKDLTLAPTAFKSGKATLDANAKKALDAVVTAIAEQGYTRVTINGYASLNGKTSKAKTKAALTLSSARAKAAKLYIAAGLAKKRIVGVTLTFKGYGVAGPIAPNKTAAGRAKNDRVQIVVR